MFLTKAKTFLSSNSQKLYCYFREGMKGAVAESSCMLAGSGGYLTQINRMMHIEQA
jgi:hypothetical protein